MLPVITEHVHTHVHVYQCQVTKQGCGLTLLPSISTPVQLAQEYQLSTVSVLCEGKKKNPSQTINGHCHHTCKQLTLLIVYMYMYDVQFDDSVS